MLANRPELVTQAPTDLVPVHLLLEEQSEDGQVEHAQDPPPGRAVSFTNCIPDTIHHFDVSDLIHRNTHLRSLPRGARAEGRRTGGAARLPCPDEAVPWPGELPPRSARWRPDLPHRGTGRVPPRPELGHPRVPQGAALPPRRVRRPPRADPGGHQPRSADGRDVPDLRGVRSRRRDLRLRFEASGRGPVRGHPGRARPLLAAQGAGRLLRRSRCAAPAGGTTSPVCIRRAPGWTRWPASR